MRALILALFCSGCAGALEDPERFLSLCDEPVCTSTNTTGARAPVALFQTSCATSGCHATIGAQAGLDLAAADLEARLSGAVSDSAACFGWALIEPGSPDDSLLYLKLTDAPCGLPMPPAQRLDTAEIQEIRTWISELTARSP